MADVPFEGGRMPAYGLGCGEGLLFCGGFFAHVEGVITKYCTNLSTIIPNSILCTHKSISKSKYRKPANPLFLSFPASPPYPHLLNTLPLPTRPLLPYGVELSSKGSGLGRNAVGLI